MFLRSFTGRIATCAGLLLVLAGCTKTGPEQGAQRTSAPAGEPLRICAGTTYSALPVIAEQKGLFAREGLNVVLIPYRSGSEAVEDMLAGKCDISTAAETLVARYGSKRDDLRILAAILKSDSLSLIVTRSQAKIRNISDLKGRRVGVAEGTAAHYFLDLLLSKNRLSEKDLQLQFKKAPELIAALRDGTLEAVITNYLEAFRMEEELGKAVVLIGDPGIALNRGYLAAREGTVAKRGSDISRLLSVLHSAELFIDENPEEAKKLFAASLKLSPRLAEKSWGSITPRLSLEPAMILALEDNGRWLREKEGGKSVHKSFREMMRPEFLRQVSPESVTIP